MPDTLLLNVIRYLNDLYWQNGLTPEQARQLATFVLELGDEAKQLAVRKADRPDIAAQLRDETTQILHDMFPETAYSPQTKRL